MVRVIPLIDRGPRTRRIAVTIGLFLVFFGCLLFVVLKAYFLYVKEGQRSAHNTAGFNITSVLADATFNETDFAGKDFIVDVELLDMDPFHSRLKMYANVTELRYIKQNGTLLLGTYKTMKLKHSAYFFDKKIEVELTGGDPNKYPYDRYVGEVPFAGYIGTDKDFVKYVTNVTTDPPPQFQYGIIARGHLQNWKFSLKWEKHDRLQGVNLLKIVVKRSPTVKLFSVFIVCLMWLISLCATMITMQIIIRGHKLLPPQISLNASLLFALPAVRNVQPNIPPIGTVTDILGFFFNMGLIAICEISLMTLWLWQSPGPDDKKDDNKNTGLGGVGSSAEHQSDVKAPLTPSKKQAY